jgi:hypothetical protein
MCGVASQKKNCVGDDRICECVVFQVLCSGIFVRNHSKYEDIFSVLNPASEDAVLWIPLPPIKGFCQHKWVAGQ